jgi:hypothetical protein
MMLRLILTIGSQHTRVRLRRQAPSRPLFGPIIAGPAGSGAVARLGAGRQVVELKMDLGDENACSGVIAGVNCRSNEVGQIRQPS